jgi:hypothetical protein
MFSLTFDKDKTDYTHLKEIIDSIRFEYCLSLENSSLYGSNTKYCEDKSREKKNILDEMEHLNIREDDEEDEPHLQSNRDYRAEH